MRLHKIIQRRIRKERDGVSFAGDVNVAIAGNVGERKATTHTSSQQDASADDQEERSKK